MGESLGSSVSIGGESDGLNGTSTFKELSQVSFSGVEGKVSNKDAAGDCWLSWFTFWSFSLGLGQFDDEGSSSEFLTAQSDGLLGLVLSGESNEADSLWSAVTVSEEIDVLDSTAGTKILFDFIDSGREWETLDKDFESWLSWLLGRLVNLGFFLGLGHGVNWAAKIK